MAAQHDVLRQVAVHPLDAAAHLAGHLRQRDGGQQREVERHVGRAGGDDRLGGKGLLAARLALPRPAVHEHERLRAAAVDVERLGRRGAVALDPRLAQLLSHPIAFLGITPDDLVGVRHPDALLVLVVERLLVVVEENFQRS